MPKLYSARVIISALQRAGFSLVSQKGSHIKFTKTKAERVLTAIVPNHIKLALTNYDGKLVKPLYWKYFSNNFFGG